MIAFCPGAPERTILHVSPRLIETQHVAALVTFSLNHIQIPGILMQIRITCECGEGAELNVDVQLMRDGVFELQDSLKPQKPSASCLNV